MLKRLAVAMAAAVLIAPAATADTSWRVEAKTNHDRIFNKSKTTIYALGAAPTMHMRVSCWTFDRPPTHPADHQTYGKRGIDASIFIDKFDRDEGESVRNTWIPFRIGDKPGLYATATVDRREPEIRFSLTNGFQFIEKMLEAPVANTAIFRLEGREFEFPLAGMAEAIGKLKKDCGVTVANINRGYAGLRDSKERLLPWRER